MSARLTQLQVFLDLVEAAGWRLDKFLVVDENQEPLRVKIALRFDPEERDDVL